MSETSVKNIQYLEAAKSAILQREDLSRQAKEQEALVKKMEAGLEQARTSVDESIDTMIKKRRSEIEASYDSHSEEILSSIRKVRARREKAKNRGMKNRMNTETADIRQKNNILKNEIRTLFQKNKVPRFCDSMLFYSLYYPRKLREIAIFLLCLVVTFGVIPCGIYLAIPQRRTLYLALIYVVDILVFGGIYLLINNKIKVPHNLALKEGRKIRDNIYTNRKHIKAIQNGIRKDTNEDMYGLEEFDRKLDKLNEDNEQVLNEKKRALDVFDGETRENIRQEIEANNEERLRQLESDLREAEATLDNLREQEQFWGRKFSERFGNTLGQEFMETEKLDLLIEAFKNGAANMMEAQETVRSEAKKG